MVNPSMVVEGEEFVPSEGGSESTSVASGLEDELGLLDVQPPAVLSLLPDDVSRRIVDIIYCLAALVESLIVTVTVSAGEFGDHPRTWTLPLFIVGSLIRMLTCVANFRTAYLSGWELIGDEQDEFPDIVRHYLRRWFAFDLACAIPFDLLALGISTDAFSVLQFARVLALARVPFLFQSSSPLNISRPMLVKGFLFFYYLVIGVHFLACLWIRSGGFSTNEDLNTSDDAFRTLYIKAAYWAITTMTTVGYGDITPSTDGARILAGITMLVGAGLFAYVMGNISNLLINEDPFKAKIKQQKKSLAGVFRYYQIPIALQKEAFCIFPVIIDKLLTQTEETIGAMPPYMRDKFMHQIKIRLVQQVTMFQGASLRIVSMLAALFRHRILSPHVYVVHQGDPGDAMFILNKGIVDVLRREPDGEETRVVSIKPGSWFGEVALICGCVRTASVRTSTGCEIFVLYRNDFTKICKRFPEFRKQVEERMPAAVAAAASAAKLQVARGSGDLRPVETGSVGSMPTARTGTSPPRSRGASPHGSGSDEGPRPSAPAMECTMPIGQQTPAARQLTMSVASTALRPSAGAAKRFATDDFILKGAVALDMAGVDGFHLAHQASNLTGARSPLPERGLQGPREVSKAGGFDVTQFNPLYGSREDLTPSTFNLTAHGAPLLREPSASRKPGRRRSGQQRRHSRGNLGGSSPMSDTPFPSTSFAGSLESPGLERVLSRCTADTITRVNSGEVHQQT